MKHLAISALAAALIAPVASYGQSYPERAVTVVIPQTPGSSSDILGRFVADGLAKRWGQPVVVENYPGAGTMIGTGEVTQAEPDGYTLLFHSSALSANAAAADNLAFDIAEDLQPVAVVATGDMVIATGSRVPLPTLADVVKQAETAELFHATAGTGTGQLLSELFAKEAGIEMEAVNYKSPPDALVDLAAGRVDLFITSVTSYLSSVAADKSTPVAVASKERATALPDVPTTAEAGYPGVVIEPWWGLLAPTGTPADILAKINADVNAVMAEPASIAFLEASHSRPEAMDVDEATAFIFGDFKLAEDLKHTTE
jgi:tripartite-type tricarboxylate transporter receptor subunit TctC